MPVDFDLDDVDDVVEEVAQQAPPPKTYRVVEDEFEEQMSEVEARLEVAQYYRLILNESLFEDAPNPDVAERVESEIRDFIRGRMQSLMGVASEEKQDQRLFTDDEVQALRTIAQPEVVAALKAIAAKILKKPAILEAKPLPKQQPAKQAPKEPMLRKVRRKPEPRVAQAQPTPTPQASRPQRKQTRTVVAEDGREVKQDVTPQARPTGTIQPIPQPRSREAIEAASAQSAAYQARVALSQLEKNLQGRYDR